MTYAYIQFHVYTSPCIFGQATVGETGVPKGPSVEKHETCSDRVRPDPLPLRVKTLLDSRPVSSHPDLRRRAVEPAQLEDRARRPWGGMRVPRVLRLASRHVSRYTYYAYTTLRHTRPSLQILLAPRSVLLEVGRVPLR